MKTTSNLEADFLSDFLALNYFTEADSKLQFLKSLLYLQLKYYLNFMVWKGFVNIKKKQMIFLYFEINPKSSCTICARAYTWYNIYTVNVCRSGGSKKCT